MTAKNESTQKPIRKKRRWLRRLLLFFLIVIILIGAAPRLLSTRFGASLLVNVANNQSESQIGLEDLSLSWRGPMLVSGLTVWDKQGRESLKLEKATLVRNLWEVMNSPGDFGELIVEGVQVTTYPVAVGAEALWPIDWSGPQPRGRLVIQSAHLQQVHPDGGVQPWFDIEGDFAIDTFNDIQGELLLSIGAGKVKTEIILRDFNAAGQLNPETVTGEVKVTTEAKFDLQKLLNLAQVQVDIFGQVQLNLQADYQKGQLSTAILTELTGLQDAQARATGTPPMDVSFTGRVAANRDQLSGSGELNSTAGAIRTEFNYPLSGRFDEILADNFLDILLKGSVVEMPDFSLEVAGSLDLPVLSRAIPSLLKMRDDIRITQGTLRVDKFSGQGGSAPQFAGSVQLADLAAAQGDKLLAFEPITVDYDLRLESAVGLNIQQSEIKSEFAQLSVRGVISNITGDFNADLSRLHRQMSDIFDLSAFNLSGDADGVFNIKRSGDDQFLIDLAFNGRTLHYELEGHQWDFPELVINYQGGLTLADNQPNRLDVTRARLDLGQQGVAQFVGWYHVPDGGLQGTLTLEQADLAWLAQQVPGKENLKLNRYAGRANLQVQIDRAAHGGFLFSTGQMQLQGITVDNQPLSHQAIVINWTDMQVDQALEFINAEAANIESELINLTAGKLHYQVYPAPGADGQLKLDADLKRLVPAAGLILEKQYPDNIAGRLVWSGACRTIGGLVGLTGRGRIDDFQIGSGDTAFREKLIELIHDTEMDRPAQIVHLKQTRLSSSLLSAQIEGTVSDYKTDTWLDLQGNYEGSWEKITQVLHGLFPQAVTVVDITGSSGSDFQITGAARRENLQPAFYELKSNVRVKWDSAQLYGVQLGPAEFSPELKQGQIVLPLTSIVAQNGKFNIQGIVDLRQAEPVLRISEPMMILDNFPVDQETGHQLLSYVNPIFAQMTRMSGLASLELGAVEIPLSENYQTNLKAHGQLSLADMQVQTEGMLSAIEQLLGLQKQVTQPMKVEKAQFDIKNGRIYYDDFRVTIARVYDLKFYGSVGFDDSLDLTVSLPVAPDLLENLGIQNPLQEFTKLITGARLEIPIVGTRTKPVLDMSKVDLAPIFQNTIEPPIKGVQNVIENIFKIIKTP